MKKLLIFMLLIGLCSCIVEAPSARGDFEFKNECSVGVLFVEYNSRYNSQDSFIIASGQSYFNTIMRSYTDYISLYHRDSLEMNFNPDSNSNARVVYKWLDNEPRNPLVLESFEEQKLGDRHYKYTYTITEEDYQNALEANGIVHE